GAPRASRPKHPLSRIEALGERARAEPAGDRRLDASDDGPHPIWRGHPTQAQREPAVERARGDGTNQLQIAHTRLSGIPEDACEADRLSLDRATERTSLPDHVALGDGVAHLRKPPAGQLDRSDPNAQAD